MESATVLAPSTRRGSAEQAYEVFAKLQNCLISLWIHHLVQGPRFGCSFDNTCRVMCPAAAAALRGSAASEWHQVADCDLSCLSFHLLHAFPDGWAAAELQMSLLAFSTPGLEAVSPPGPHLACPFVSGACRLRRTLASAWAPAVLGPSGSGARIVHSLSLGARQGIQGTGRQLPEAPARTEALAFAAAAAAATATAAATDCHEQYDCSHVCYCRRLPPALHFPRRRLCCGEMRSCCATMPPGRCFGSCELWWRCADRGAVLVLMQPRQRSDV